MIKAKIVRADAVKKMLERRSKLAPGVLAAACYLFACTVVRNAMRLVPVATGYLRRSRFVTKPEVGASPRFSIEVGFGASYAQHVERNTSAAHVVGQARFLATARADGEAGLRPFINAHVAKFMRAGITIEALSAQQPREHVVNQAQEWAAAQRRARMYKSRARRSARRARTMAGRVE